MSNWNDIREAYHDANDMESLSILAEDDDPPLSSGEEMERFRSAYEAERDSGYDALPAHKRPDYLERMADLADYIRDRARDDRLTGDL